MPHAEVLQDDGVNADVLQGAEHLDQLGQFVLADEGVDGDEDASRRGEGVGVAGDLVEPVEGGGLGLGAGGKLFQAGGNGVGAGVKRRAGRLGAAGGGGA